MKTKKERIESIKRFYTIFPCANRDQLARLFFSDRSNPVLKCTQLMQELREDGWIVIDPYRKPYVYFSKPVKRARPKSAQLDHWLSLVDVYTELLELGVPLQFIRPEKPFGKGYPRVDLMVKINDIWLFTEVQRSHTSNEKIQQKIEGYERLYYHGKHEEICEEFTIWILSEEEYTVYSDLPLIQTKTVKEVLSWVK